MIRLLLAALAAVALWSLAALWGLSSGREVGHLG
jgi:hypothetical protein